MDRETQNRMDSDTRLRMADSVPRADDLDAEDNTETEGPEPEEECCDEASPSESVVRERSSSLPPTPRECDEPTTRESKSGTAQPKTEPPCPDADKPPCPDADKPPCPDADKAQSAEAQAAQPADAQAAQPAGAAGPTPDSTTADTCVARKPPKLRVLVDMDGVLADFEGAAFKLWRATYPDEPFVAPENRRGYYIKQQYASLRADLGEKMVGIYTTAKFFTDMEPLPGAIDAIKEMTQMADTEVLFCTTSLRTFDNCLPEKYGWIRQYLGPEFVDKIIIIRDKTLVDGHLLFDDKDTITGLKEKPSWEHILMSTAHNKDVVLPPPKQRLESWGHDWKSILERKRQELACNNVQ
ncbi:5'(3')-deoxyribonucleotidase, cytosolic type [Ambystoma mexicanum]|uniref:5'(3')-deoxyribonucleotidase, cytosolic type n=1 Tax=Ambystoma mexicanum TaxID=8296 RepID=UPI0037E7872F